MSVSYSASSLYGTCTWAVLSGCLLHLLWKEEKKKQYPKPHHYSELHYQLKKLKLFWISEAVTANRTSDRNNYHALCFLQKPHRFPRHLWKTKWKQALETNFRQPEMLHPLAQLWKCSHFQPHPKALHLVTTANSETDRSTTVTECHYKRGFQIVFFPILSP